jgi:hypothetical protein
MKNFTQSAIGIICMLVIILFISARQEDKNGIARVRKVLGIEVYVLCEPLREYEVVGTVKYLGKVTESIYSRVEGHVAASKWKEDIKYDAILIDDQRGASLIKFK